MLSTYLNTLVAAGLVFEQMVEPIGTGESSEQIPGRREAPVIMLVRAHR
jgi:hypothetical protein